MKNKKNNVYVNQIHDMPLEDHLNDIYNFACFSYDDHIWCFSKKKGGCLYELNVICEEESYFKKEKLSDLITRNNIKYLSFSIWEAANDVAEFVNNVKSGILEIDYKPTGNFLKSYSWVCPENRDNTDIY